MARKKSKKKIGTEMKASNNTFKIYTPVKKVYISNDLIVYLLIGFGVLSATSFAISNLIGRNLSLIIGMVFLICLILSFLVCVGLAIRAVFKYQPLYGVLSGQVIFENDSISVDNRVYELDDISKINFAIIDHKDLYIGRRGGLDGRKSQGVGNTFSFMVDNKQLTYQFQLLYKGQIKEIKDQLISYHIAGKLHFLHLIELLGITKYEDIQEFKQQLAAGLK